MSPAFSRHYVSKHLFLESEMAFPLPPPPHRPGFSDKEIFLVEASLVFELPHMTFPSELYLVRGKRCFSGLVLLLLTVHLDFLFVFWFLCKLRTVSFFPKHYSLWETLTFLVLTFNFPRKYRTFRPARAERPEVCVFTVSPGRVRAAEKHVFEWLCF